MDVIVRRTASRYARETKSYARGHTTLGGFAMSRIASTMQISQALVVCAY
jgi:hypothetical protein